MTDSMGEAAVTENVLFSNLEGTVILKMTDFFIPAAVRT
jgi:hypothetical protein